LNYARHKGAGEESASQTFAPHSHCKNLFAQFLFECRYSSETLYPLLTRVLSDFAVRPQTPQNYVNGCKKVRVLATVKSHCFQSLSHFSRTENTCVRREGFEKRTNCLCQTKCVCGIRPRRVQKSVKGADHVPKMYDPLFRFLLNNKQLLQFLRRCYSRTFIVRFHHWSVIHLCINYCQTR